MSGREAKLKTEKERQKTISFFPFITYIVYIGTIYVAERCQKILIFSLDWIG